jgi:diguanylate cyclase (GGDEF)-like protein
LDAVAGVIAPRRVLVVVIAVVVAFNALVLALPEALIPHRTALTDWANLAAAALAAGCASWRATRSADRYRWSWGALAAGCASWTAGQVEWIYLNTTGTYAYPSAADPAFLLFPPLACLALLMHPTDDDGQRLRRVLDAVMTGLAAGLVIWAVALRAVVQSAAAGEPLAGAVSIAYPTLDLLLLVLTVLTLTHSPAARLPLGLITLGLTAFVVADIIFIYQTAGGSNPLDLIDLGWSLGFGCISMAALVDQRPPRQPLTTPSGVPIVSLVPYLPTLVAVTVAVIPQLSGQALPLEELLMAAALVLVLLGRQYLTMRQNQRLTTALTQQEAQLRHQAFHDGLTGLANRALFRNRLEHAVDLHARDLRPVSVLFLDLDDFKVVNDTLGHATGDALLVRTAERLRGAMRGGDTIARLGGDEFAVLLEDGSDPLASAARITDALRAPFDLDGRRIDVAVSIGVVELARTHEPADADELLARADTAMYAAKRSGKSRTVAYRPGMTLSELEDQRLRTVLLTAIGTGDIQLAYQPIVELPSRRVVAVEALARWQRAGHDVSADDLIADATRTGVLPELTAALLAQACAQIAEWSPRGPLAVHVNVAPSQLADGRLLDDVRTLARRHGLVPGQLILEITESGLLSEMTTAYDNVRALRRDGIGISLDDFGVGHSSLSRLHDIELDSVKIDRSFVERIDSHPRHAVFLSNLLGLARDISLPVIAEGVERVTQLTELERLGCPMAQGYIFGRPAPAADLALTIEHPVPSSPQTGRRRLTRTVRLADREVGTTERDR